MTLGLGELLAERERRRDVALRHDWHVMRGRRSDCLKAAGALGSSLAAEGRESADRKRNRSSVGERVSHREHCRPNERRSPGCLHRGPGWHAAGLPSE